MSILDSLFNSEVLQEKAFGIFKKMMSDKGLEFIVLRVDGDGNMELSMYKPGEASITIAGAVHPIEATPAETKIFKTKKANGKTDNKKRK